MKQYRGRFRRIKIKQNHAKIIRDCLAACSHRGTEGPLLPRSTAEAQQRLQGACEYLLSQRMFPGRQVDTESILPDHGRLLHSLRFGSAAASGETQYMLGVRRGVPGWQCTLRSIFNFQPVWTRLTLYVQQQAVWTCGSCDAHLPMLLAAVRA